MKARDIAEILGAPVEGDGDREIRGGNVLELATAAEVAFVEGPKAGRAAADSLAGCLIVGPDGPSLDGRTLIRVPEPRNAFARVMRALYPPARPKAGIHPAAVIAKSAAVGDGVSIGAYCVVGEEARIGDNCVLHNGVSIGDGCTLGQDCRLHPGVVLYHQVTLGDRVILHAGCVIGSDGFGYALEGGRYEKFPQIGVVRIGNDVEIGANSCVDRAALGVTSIGDGTKLDNLVHIGHNCKIGQHVVIAAQTGLSGGVEVEDHVVMGGQVGIGEKARVGNKAVVGGQSGILPRKSIHAGETVWGTPSRPHREHLEKLASVSRLPRIAAKVEDIRRRLERLEGL